MVNSVATSLWLIGGWLSTVAIITVISATMGAALSTTALLGALAIAPAVVVALLAQGAPSPSVAQILHAIETNDDRS